MPDSTTGFTVKTNGQTLVVTAYRQGNTSYTPAVYTTGALSSAITLPYTATSDTNFYMADSAHGTWVVSVKQPDGTELFGREIQVAQGGLTVVEPSPSALQVGADAGSDGSGFKVGDYYMTFHATNAATQALTLDRLTLAPWYVPADVTIDRLGAEVTSAGTAGSVLRLGIYTNNSEGMPGSLVLDAGTIDGTSNTVQTITLGSTTTLRRGIYWFGGVAQVAACTVRVPSGIYTGFPIGFGTSVPTANQVNVSMYQSSVSGALPAVFARSGVGTTNVPRLHFRVA